MKLINADQFIADAKRIYAMKKWQPWELHFSLNDLTENIESVESVECTPEDIMRLAEEVSQLREQENE